MRRLLQPHYVEVDRNKKPKNFIHALPEEYNDILNNYRVVLGEYQFRRCLLAKKYLYKDQWDSMFSFAFSREPTDRCVSMFYYLYWQDSKFIKNIYQAVKGFSQTGKLLHAKAYAFDVFLDYAHKARTSNSIYSPLGNHFTTHTAPMWEDITDMEGNILLKKVFRIENLTDGINQAFQECNIPKKIKGNTMALNKNAKRSVYKPTKEQIKKIESIYPHDFEIYELAEH